MYTSNSKAAEALTTLILWAIGPFVDKLAKKASADIPEEVEDQEPTDTE